MIAALRTPVARSNHSLAAHVAISDDIKARLDIVDVVAEYVPELKKSGRNFSARCPFHQERTPSFVVFPDRQTWRCFGACATGGDIFTFVMRVENTEFTGALRSLAARAGVTLAERRRSEAPRSPILTANDAALRFFRESLAADRGAMAREYLERRGLGDEAVASFGLGYSPATGDELLRQLQPLGIGEELLLSAGLVTRGAEATGTLRDLFRGRLIFPIRDAAGEVVGFAGRALDDAVPKYLNTPQTPLFDKGRLLYGLDKGSEAVSQEGRAVVVEGYMDVIAAHEHGYRNVVASMGTALTEHQVALLHSRTPQIVLALDPDAAGQGAMFRELLATGISAGRAAESVQGRSARFQRSGEAHALRVVTLPEGQDPDAVIRSDPSQWRVLVESAVPVLDFLLSAAHANLDLTTSQGKTQAAEALMPLIYAADWTEQDRYTRKLAGLLDVTPETLMAAVGRARNNRRPRRQQAGAVESAFRGSGIEGLEDHTLALLVHYPELLERLGELAGDRFQRAESRAVLSAIEQAGTIEGARAQLDDQIGEYLERLLDRVLPPADFKQRHADLDACIRRLEERFLRELKAQEEVALAQVSEDGPDDSADYLEAVHRQALDTNERLRKLFAGDKETVGG